MPTVVHMPIVKTTQTHIQTMEATAVRLAPVYYSAFAISRHNASAYDSSGFKTT